MKYEKWVVVNNYGLVVGGYLSEELAENVASDLNEKEPHADWEATEDLDETI